MLDLTTAGYTDLEDEMNPYRLYNKIATIVPKESEARAEILTIEMFNLRSHEYNNIKTFLNRLTQLRLKLDDIDNIFQDRSIITILIRGLQDQYPQFTENIKI